MMHLFGWILFILPAATGLSLPTGSYLPAGRALIPTKSVRAPDPVGKFVGAALAAAFASKNDAVASAEQRSLAETENQVIQAIRDVLDAGVTKPRRTWSALGDFGKASGSLAQTWLTPQQVESVVAFWGCGSAVLVRDLQRGKLTVDDLKAAGWFALLAINTFPWTPLLVPLVARAVNATDGSAAFVPACFGDRRLAALRRLRDDSGLGSVDTPQNIDEGVSFFTDGSRMLMRDVWRGRVPAHGDTLAAYGRFLLLTFSTFPLTPLLIPVIDKRRDGRQSDYVPASFRARRLAAFARLRAAQTSAFKAPAEVIAASMAPVPAERPSPAELLAAIVALPPTSKSRGQFLEKLAGGGTPGKRWRLVYSAGKDAVTSARQRRKQQGGAGSAAMPSWLDSLGEAALPWTWLKHGLYLDSYVTAVQRFDASTHENENGVFAICGAEWLQFSLTGPFKWPQPEMRAVCAFQPTMARGQLGEWEWEWPLKPPTAALRSALWSTPAEAQDAATALPFDETPVTKLPFFKFLLVDETVAVAQGRSGGVAVWARMDG